MKDENNITNINPAVNQPEAKRPPGAEIYEWFQCIVSALLLCVLVFVFLFRVTGVVGDSMYPTLHWGDKVITSNLFYTPENGDIVVLQKDAFSPEPLVKRVIATEGQTVDIDFDAGIVYVDGIALHEDYIAEPTNRQIDFSGEITVPDGCIFVLGDNRNASSDSRDERIGCVDTRHILGKVVFRILPVGDFGSVYK